MDHVCVREGRHLFCNECGKAFDVAELATVRMKGFTGKDSLSPRVRAFLNTGEPEVLDPRVRIDGAGLD